MDSIPINQIIHGDCLEVMKDIPDKSVDLVVTSPPYPGINNMWGELFKAENYQLAHKFLNKVWNECLRILRNGGKLSINIANTKRRPYLPNTHKIYTWAENKMEALGEIIWDKHYGQIGTAWGSYCNPSDPALADQHEYILIFRKFGERIKFNGYHINARDFKSWRNSLWRIAPEKASKIGHCAPFPLTIPRRLIILYSYESETVLDPFSGSGTTAIACLETGRNYICIEKDKTYYDLSIKRINDYKSQMKMEFVAH